MRILILKGTIGLKKFKNWFSNVRKEASAVLFPPLIQEYMIPQDTYELKNGQVAEVGLASVADLDAIIKIQEACYDGVAPWGRIAVNNELRNKGSSFFLMLYHDFKAIAFIGMSARQNRLHVTNIATHPAYQKNGIASFLIKTVIAIAEQLNKDRVTLEVRMSNIEAIRLYRNLGFNDVHIKRNYYHNNGEDALDMVYLLNETYGVNE